MPVCVGLQDMVEHADAIVNLHTRNGTEASCFVGLQEIRDAQIVLIALTLTSVPKVYVVIKHLTCLEQN